MYIKKSTRDLFDQTIAEFEKSQNKVDEYPAFAEKIGEIRKSAGCKCYLRGVPFLNVFKEAMQTGADMERVVDILVSMIKAFRFSSYVSNVTKSELDASGFYDTNHDLGIDVRSGHTGIKKFNDKWWIYIGFAKHFDKNVYWEIAV